ncbi:MAG: hypothetical protein ABIF10_01115, partial [Candidatus Woesearchaeota archaeon]
MEIEIRAYVENASDVKNNLRTMKAAMTERTEIEDRWYCQKQARNYEETRMGRKGSNGVRIRLQKNKPAQLTIKQTVRTNDDQ